MSVSSPAPIMPLEEVHNHLPGLRKAGDAIVLTNGCFDLLHQGHITFLQRCADLGDRLLVGLNTDQSVARLKGPGRPVLPESARADILAAIRWVDAVIVFPQSTADELIRLVKPDIYAKGADYDPQGGGRGLPEIATVRDVGTRLELIPLVPGASTATLVEQIRVSTERED